jgi:hypothetical protein
MKRQANTDDARSFQVILRDDFTDNRHGWEITNSALESAALKEEGYCLENKDRDNWHHFSIVPGLESFKDVLIQCRIEVDPKAGPGQLGLIWGFDQNLRHLNRFCFSSGGRGCTVMHFQRNHRPVFHQFYDPFFQIDLSRPVLMEMRKKNGYWLFRINKERAYIGHQSHFSSLGTGIGFYLDPGVSIRVKTLQVSRLVLSKASS